MYLFSLNGVTRGLITSRPSKTCKTPYVADIVIDDWKSGVEIKTLQVEWNREGECVFVRNDLPIILE